jgi:hypothetical protein
MIEKLSVQFSIQECCLALSVSRTCWSVESSGNGTFLVNWKAQSTREGIKLVNLLNTIGIEWLRGRLIRARAI